MKYLLFSVLPDPRKLNERVGCDDLVYRLGYGLFWIKLRIALAIWHRNELAKCDPGYEDRELDLLLVKERMKAQEKGISASDPQYPSLDSVRKQSK